MSLFCYLGEHGSSQSKEIEGPKDESRSNATQLVDACLGLVLY